MQIDIWGRENQYLVDAIGEAWRRLPRDVQQRLDHIVFTKGRYKRPSWASAGEHDIDFSAAPPSTKAMIGLCAHELAHVVHRHAQQLRAGAISTQEAERQADRTARLWGFEDELREAYFFKGD